MSTEVTTKDMHHQFTSVDDDGHVMVAISMSPPKSNAAFKPVFDMTRNAIRIRYDGEASASASAPLLEQLEQPIDNRVGESGRGSGVSVVEIEDIKKKKPTGGVRIHRIEDASSVQLRKPARPSTEVVQLKRPALPSTEVAQLKRPALPSTEVAQLKRPAVPLPSTEVTQYVNLTPRRQRTPSPVIYYRKEAKHYRSSQCQTMKGCCAGPCKTILNYLTYILAVLSAFLQAVYSLYLIVVVMAYAFFLKTDEVREKIKENAGLLNIFVGSLRVESFLKKHDNTYFDDVLHFKIPVVSLSLFYIIICVLLCYGLVMRKPWWVAVYFTSGVILLIIRIWIQNFPKNQSELIAFWSIFMDESTPRDTSLNAYLRYTLALPGTKAMCHEGGCGACVVSVRARRASGTTEAFSVNSCLVLVFSCHGWDITTIEGVGSRLTGYSDVQKRMAAFNASQCGYCTPGWVMHMTSLQDKHLTMAELERSFGSNTCRCTGFRPILDVMKSFAVDASADLCQKVNDIEDIKICSKTNTICERRCSAFSEESDWSVISDQHLDKLEKKDDKMIAFSFGKQKFFKIYDEDDVFDLLDKYGVDSYMFVDGNTGKGVVETFEYPRIMIDISGVKSLKKYNFDQNLILGANMALEDCITLFKDTSQAQSEFSYLAEFVKHFELIAHIPVRRIGSLAGNLMLKHANPSYQSDVFLLLEAVGAVVVIKNTFTDFLKYDMRGMLMVAIELPPLGTTYVFRSYKIMPRNQNALAIVNAAFLFKINAKSKIIEKANICYGNISPTFVHAKDTEAFLKGKMVFNNVVLQAAIKMMNKEIVPKYDPAQPSSDFRKKLAVGLFYKAILSICPPNELSPRYRSGASLVQRPLSKGSQEYQTDSSLYPLNQPVPKLEAAIQAAGEAKYANDIPPMPREVFGAFVQSTVHSGELLAVDSSEVLDLDGVIAVYTAKDIPGVNSFSVPGFQLQTEEEEIIASKNILFYGQPVAIVIANSEALAVKIANKVKVTYKNVPSSAPVLSIDQAKKDSKRYVASDVAIEPKGKGNDVKKVIKGVYEIEGQYHYYMEPVTCVVVPVDQGLEVYDSTQWMDLTQRAISRCLNMKESDIHLKVRRIGGGFGGKISRNVRTSTACALAAKLLNTPCRFVVPLQTNLATAGGRLPCQCEYEVGVDDNGKIQYLNATIVEDNGCSNNENILSYATPGFTNCYDPDYFDVKTATVTTDTPSNTFARAPGTSEGMACIEHIMEHIAFSVQKDPTDVRIANMRTDDNDLPSLIELWKKETDYEKRLQSIQEFNKANRWMKKAIKINIMCFPVEYYGNYSAMVSIYRGDGSVTVTTGGVEMGQGVNTKVAQVVAYKLGIPLELVTVLPNYSFTAANNVFSGSSIVSESVSYATIKSCDTLNSRLEPIRQKMSNPSWSELIKQAGDDQIDLTASYMMTDKESDLASYSAFAVAILEVQLDVLTARYEILRADILEDVGLSANPTIDVSQVEGAYVQGLGYFTTEKLVRDPKTGRLLSNRSLTYHVPLALDIPADFRVKLRFNSKNKTGVLGSKAVGEMGICTAHGITHVLRQCIHESRADSRYDTKNWINIDVPYDAESIMTALDVKLEEFLIT